MRSIGLKLQPDSAKIGQRRLHELVMNDTPPNAESATRAKPNRSGDTSSFPPSSARETDGESRTIGSTDSLGGFGTRVPPIIAGYEIIEELGRGGMGVIYKAQQTSLKRVVALKMVLAGAHASQDELVRFRREAEAAAQLQHPNIVQVHEVGTQDDCPFLSMEFVDGGSLSDRLKKAPSPIRWSAQLVESLARAVHVAHQHGIIHRDLKPSNILLTADGVAKIADFGLAKRIEGGMDHTQSGTIIGTPSYMAPEQAGGQTKTVGPRSDIYSLGAILYELLTGRPPFRMEAPLETLLQVVSREPDRPRSINPTVPRDLETICLHALAKESQQRYPTASELADDLARFLEGRPILARPVSRMERSWRWCRRNPGIAAMTAVVATLLLVVGGLLLSRGNGRELPADDSLARVKQAGKLVMATDPTYPPMEFRENGDINGFDIEVGRMIARRLGVKAEFRVVDWDWQHLCKRLNTHEFDLIISSITDTEERRQQVDFVPYEKFSTVLVCRKGVVIRTENDLAEKTVDVQVDTTAYRMASAFQRKGIPLKIQLSTSTPDPFEKLQKKQADLTFAHEPVARYYAKKNPDFAVITELKQGSDPIGMAFCKRDKKLQTTISEVVGALKTEGIMARLAAQWFGD